MTQSTYRNMKEHLNSIHADVSEKCLKYEIIEYGTTTPWHTDHITLPLYDRPHSCSAFQVTRKDLRSSLKMAHVCRNM
jgi:hypothetical protein